MNVAIIGGGACGVMCAIKLKKLNKDLNVTVFEQNDRILKKVLKTGNGKCNILNNLISKEMYNDFRLIENNRNIDVYQELLELGIVLKETTLGRVYPYSESSKTVVNVLLRNLESLGVEVITNCNIVDVKYQNKLYYLNKKKFDVLVIASGSKAQEATTGYNLVKSLGHLVSTLTPGLTPIITYEKTDSLQGLRLKCDAYVNSKKISGEVLFKNDGLSGILTLDISRLVNVGDEIILDLMPEYSFDEIKKMFDNNFEHRIVLEGIFSKMLANDLLKRSNNLDSLIKNIKKYKFTVKGLKDFKEAQIVCGGVKLDEINDDFSSRIKNNLYLGGEILNVDGACGGYNLYFAWLSGIVIANSIVNKF